MGDLPPLLLQSRLAIANSIIQLFSVRIHAGIARKPWARLWYLARGLDLAGRGFLNLSADAACQLLAVSRSTLYEWLRLGRECGAFRSYKFRGNCLSLWLGGLHKVCRNLRLESWGAVATVPLSEVNRKLRAIATGIATADLQSKSHFAARRSLKERERKIFAPPKANIILAAGKQSSLNLGEEQSSGAIAFLLHVGDSKAFVSKSFVPFGASQESIGYQLGISEWSVRRHHRALALERRQLVQAKAAYGRISFALNYPWHDNHLNIEPGIDCYRTQDNQTWLVEPNGSVGSPRPSYAVDRNRFFRFCGKDWIYRCNLYAVSQFHLESMKTSRRQYEANCASSQSTTSGGELTTINVEFPSHPRKDEQNP